MKAGTLPRLDYDTILCDVLNGDDIEFWREHSQDVINAVQKAMRHPDATAAGCWQIVNDVVVDLAEEWANVRAAGPFRDFDYTTERTL